MSEFCNDERYREFLLSRTKEEIVSYLLATKWERDMAVKQLNDDYGVQLFQEKKEDIGMKPIDREQCPVCYSLVSYLIVNKNLTNTPILVHDNFCATCGQRIDWSDN